MAGYWRSVVRRLLVMVVRASHCLPDMFGSVNLYDDPEFARWVQQAYADMVEWFGEPRDPDWPIVAHYCPFGGIDTKHVDGRWSYALFVPVRLAHMNGAYLMLAMLVCERVLYDRPGIVREPWIAHLVAVCAGLQSTIRRGYTDVRDELLHQASNAPSNAALVSSMKLWDGDRLSKLGWLRGRKQPPIVKEIYYFGVRLEHALGWEAIRTLALAQTWSE